MDAVQCRAGAGQCSAGRVRCQKDAGQRSARSRQVRSPRAPHSRHCREGGAFGRRMSVHPATFAAIDRSHWIAACAGMTTSNGPCRQMAATSSQRPATSPTGPDKKPPTLPKESRTGPAARATNRGVVHGWSYAAPARADAGAASAMAHTMGEVHFCESIASVERGGTKKRPGRWFPRPRCSRTKKGRRPMQCMHDRTDGQRADDGQCA